MRDAIILFLHIHIISVFLKTDFTCTSHPAEEAGELMVHLCYQGLQWAKPSAIRHKKLHAIPKTALCIGPSDLMGSSYCHKILTWLSLIPLVHYSQCIQLAIHPPLLAIFRFLLSSVQIVQLTKKERQISL